MRSELRAEIHGTANHIWRDLCDQARELGREALRQLTDERFPEFSKIIEYDNRQLVEELLPAYRRMVNIFRENMWLAEEDTRAHFATLLKFVDLWDRWLAKAIPREVAEAIGHEEDSLQPLYKDLQEKHDNLRGRLAQGDV